MAKKKTVVRKDGFTWSKVKPYASMVLGGTVGLLASAFLPEGAAPYAAALGVAGSKVIGGGGWGKYLLTAGVVGGLVFVSRRNTIRVATGALKQAKGALMAGRVPSPSAPVGESASDKGNKILRNLVPAR